MIHTVHMKRAYKFLRQSKKFPDTSIWKKNCFFFGISFREDCSLSNSEQYPQPYLLIHINSDICRGISFTIVIYHKATYQCNLAVVASYRDK